MSEPPVVIIGAGGHAHVVIEALRRAGCVPDAVLDPLPGLYGRPIGGVAVLGDDRVLDRWGPNGVRLVLGIGRVLDGNPRRAAFRRLKARGYRFLSVIHPGAVVAADLEYGEGAQVMAGAVVQPGCRLGAGSLVNTGAAIDHHGRLGDFAHLAPGATLCGEVTVGAGAHVGAGATVIEGVAIGDEAIVAAGATVVGPVRAGARVFGTPAREGPR